MSPSYDDDKLRIGSLSADWVPIEGNGEFRYGPKNIACYEEALGQALPDEILRRVADLKAARAQADDSRTRFPHNSKIPSLQRFTVARSDQNEEPRMTFVFGISDYFTFLATSAFAAQLDAQYDEAGEKTSLRKHYLGRVERDHLWDEPVPELSHSFGIYLALATADRKVILVQRRGWPRTVSRPEFTTSVTEGMSWTLDRVNSTTLDPFRTAQRGVAEELGSEISLDTITILNFGVNPRFYQYALLARADTNLTADEIDRSRRTHAKDRFEVDAIHAVDFTCSAVADFVASHDPWSSPGLACVLYALISEYGWLETDRAFTGVDKEVVG